MEVKLSIHLFSTAKWEQVNVENRGLCRVSSVIFSDRKHEKLKIENSRGFQRWCLVSVGLTLPETNIARENRPLEKEIPIGNHHF